MTNYFASISRILEESGRNISVEENVPLSKKTSFKIGGPADAGVFPESIEDFEYILKLLKNADIPFYVFGRGSNLLVSDEGYRGVAVFCERLDKVSFSGNTVVAEAGVGLTALSRQAAAQGLSGLEFACGIPGSVGGGVVMNAGAYGGEMSDVLVSCKCYSPENGIITVKRTEALFSYRHSRFFEKSEIVLSVELALTCDDPKNIVSRCEELLTRRREKQPLEYPSAGSAFKRPKGYFAAKLIEDAGLKGLSVGGAQVSEKHSGFVINRKDATCRDVLVLMSRVKDAVFEKYGVMLESEVRYLSETGERCI